MTHSLKISLADPGQRAGIVRCRNVTLRERLLRHFLGNPSKVTIIVPGESVKELSIKELSREEVEDGDS